MSHPASWRLCARRLLAVSGLLTGACSSSIGAPPFGRAVTDPQQAVIETGDIPRYWEAVDSGGTAADFDRLYLARASAGLREFTRLRQLNGTALAQVRSAVPNYLNSIRATSLALGSDTAVANGIRRNYAVMQQRYADAIFPPLTFLFGRFSTGGTVGDAGILIGAEFYAKAPTSPTQELNAFARANIRPADSVTIIVAHEHVHVLQSAAQGLMSHANKTLLEMSLLEGSADFVGELVSGGNINAGLHAWALAREDSLWTAFRSVMHGRNYAEWLYNQQNATPTHPGDLGYFIGYRIAKAYYDSTPDKTAALRAIITMSDASAFVTASGYAP
ncbi:MAG: hypothetical protein IT357_05895 [Gemmatimonadaceae bacterium]|nr:hypothetical protein [Gemmatimonadaceae bacterium]